MEEYARWRNGIRVMQAVNACFGGEYPNSPFDEDKKCVKDKKGLEDTEGKDLTEEEIIRAREILVMNLSILEGRNQREKAREERQRLREQQEQESDSE